MPIPVGEYLGLRLIHGSFLNPHESAANGISIDSAVFAQLTRVYNTDHAMCDIGSNRMHLCM